MMKLVSWQSVLTEHQLHLMCALRATLGSDLTVISGARNLREREEQGWTSVDSAEFEFRVLPERGWWKAAKKVIDGTQDAVHLFGGVFADRRFLLFMLYCKAKGVRVSLMSEPYAEVAVGYFNAKPQFTNKIKNFLRPAVYRLVGLILGRSLFALFPISSLAELQFQRNGFQARGVYPFAYFVPMSQEVPGMKLSAGARDVIKIIFVGSLIKRKGIEVLLTAWRSVQASIGQHSVRLMLDVYGTGVVDESEWPANAFLKGPIPFGRAQAVIAQYDVLVLPSLHDGWGVVVNEALLQGVPAIVSDRVGAQVLVRAGNAGAIFKSGSVAELANILVNLAADPNQLEGWAKGAKRIAPHLNPTVGAEYLLACLDQACNVLHAAPLPPWTRR